VSEFASITIIIRRGKTRSQTYDVLITDLMPSSACCFCVCMSVYMLSTGEDSLATLHRFLNENFDWLVSQLNVSPLLSAGVESSVTQPVLSLSQQPPHLSRDTDRLSEDFNPLKTFASIGHSQFNHVRTNDFVVDFVFVYATFIARFSFLGVIFSYVSDHQLSTVFMVALCNRADHYIFILFLSSLFFFFFFFLA